MHVQYVQSYSYTVQLRVAVVGLANCFCCTLQVVILLKHLVIAVAFSLLCKFYKCSDGKVSYSGR